MKLQIHCPALQLELMVLCIIPSRIRDCVSLKMDISFQFKRDLGISHQMLVEFSPKFHIKTNQTKYFKKHKEK